MKRLIAFIRKITSLPFRILHTQSPRIQYYSLKIARKLYSSPKDLEDIERENRERPWWNAKGDTTLRLDYDKLDSSKVVIDAGGFRGDWASAILDKYGCTIHVFEPVPDFYSLLQNRFKKNDRLHLYCSGLGIADEKIKLYVDYGSSSTFKKSKSSVDAQMVEVGNFIKKIGGHVDLLKINIEGGEYDLLEHIIKHNYAGNIDNIQIQFHNFIPNAIKRRQKIQEQLSKTHTITYNFDFIWENWEKNPSTT